MSLPYPSMDFVPFDVLTAAELDQLVSNIESLSSGSGLATGSVGAINLAANAVLLDYNATTVAQTSLGAETDITGFSSTVSIPSGGRSVLIIATVHVAHTAATSPNLYFKEGSTYLQRSLLSVNNTTNPWTHTVTCFIPTPSAGSHTYKMAISFGGSGTGGIFFADSTGWTPNMAVLLV